MAASKKSAAKAAAKPEKKKATPAKAAAKPATKAAAKPAAKAAAKAPAKAKAPAPVAGKYTKTQLLTDLATSTELNKKQVSALLDELAIIIGKHIGKKGPGEFTLPGLLKIKTVKKPAQKARKGVPNPFKPGETMDVPAKPASTKVKVLPLKKLKDLAG